MQLDQAKLDEFVGKILNDMGQAATGAMVLIGDKLGLYKALAEGGPLASAELAVRTGTAERYTREWLAAQAAAGYIQYQPETGKYAMTTEQAMVLADDSSPAFMAGGFEVFASMFKDEPKISEAFKTGRGVGWHEHSPCLFRGTERFFRTGYAAHLVQEWLPASRECGRSWNGEPTWRMWAAATARRAFSWPGRSPTRPSLASTIMALRSSGLGRQRARPDLSSAAGSRSPMPRTIPATTMTLSRFSIACTTWAIRPRAKHVRQSLDADGTWLIVEPYASDAIEDNFNPVGRIYYAASTMICVPASLSQDVGLALGTKRVKHACVKWLCPVALPAFAAQRQRHSI